MDVIPTRKLTFFFLKKIYTTNKTNKLEVKGEGKIVTKRTNR